MDEIHPSGISHNSDIFTVMHVMKNNEHNAKHCAQLLLYVDICIWNKGKSDTPFY